jgi:hypothetical protein
MRILPLTATAVAIVAATSLPATTLQSSGAQPSPSTTAPHVYSLGDVSVTVPPPQGFEEMLGRSAEFRERLIQNERLVNLAAHLPGESVKTFTPQQDLPLYTKVSVSRAAMTADISDEFFEGLIKQQAATSLYDQDFLKKYLADLGKRQSVAIEKPIPLGTIDQTSKSFSTLALMAISQGDRRLNLLVSSSFLHVRRRLIFAYVYRIVESQKDQALIETLTKQWVRSILAANP